MQRPAICRSCAYTNAITLAETSFCPELNLASSSVTSSGPSSMAHLKLILQRNGGKRKCAGAGLRPSGDQRSIFDPLFLDPVFHQTARSSSRKSKWRPKVITESDRCYLRGLKLKLEYEKNHGDAEEYHRLYSEMLTYANKLVAAQRWWEIWGKEEAFAILRGVFAIPPYL